MSLTAFTLICAGVGVFTAVLAKKQSESGLRPALMIFGLLFLMTLASFGWDRAIMSAILSVLGFYLAAKVIGDDEGPSLSLVPSRGEKAKPSSPPAVIGSVFSDLLPTRHLVISGTDGSGISTFLGLAAKAARGDGRPVMVISRHETDLSHYFEDISQDEGFVFRALPFLDDFQNAFPAYHADLIEEAVIFSKRENAVILIDKMPGRTPLDEGPSEILPMLRNGAHVVTCGFGIPDRITPTTSLLVLKTLFRPSALFGVKDAEVFQAGEGLLIRPQLANARVRIQK